MSEPSGWKYLRHGECSQCHDTRTMVFVPVMEGATPVEGDNDLVTGEHLPHFEPVCKACTKGYNLNDPCAKHRLPRYVTGEGCRLCFKR